MYNKYYMKQRTEQLGERGMASIFVTMIMMVVISLIVLGFGQVVRRSQRETLDRQLSSQAYYAAESGINDVYHLVKADPTYVTSSLDANDCTNFILHNSVTLNGNPVGALHPDLGSNVSYSCLLVNTHPPQLTRSSLGIDQNQVWKLNDPAAPFTDLKFKWSTKDGNVPAAAQSCRAPFFDTSHNQTATAWVGACSFGMLRVDLLDLSDTDTSVFNPNADTTADNLNSKTLSLYISPGSGSGSATITSFSNPNIKAQKLVANCPVGSDTCSIDIDVSAVAAANYYARFSMMYEPTSGLTVQGDNSHGPSDFVGAVVDIDSTGKASDELRRVRVQVPLNGDASDITGNALQTSGDICKQITLPSSGSPTKGSCTVW